jgi:hypothetical protein
MLFVFQQANLKRKEYEQRVIGYVRDISKFCLAPKILYDILTPKILISKDTV